MTCGHCEKAIRQELTKGDPRVRVDVNLKDKLVTVENLPDDRVLFLLREAGYAAESVK
jgi:copper chaperone CopZ